MSEKLTSLLKLQKEETSNYGVIFGLGTTIEGKGVCKSVELMIGDWRVIDSFLPLELGGRCDSQDAMAPLIRGHRGGLEESYYDILQGRSKSDTQR